MKLGRAMLIAVLVALSIVLVEACVLVFLAPADPPEPAPVIPKGSAGVSTPRPGAGDIGRGVPGASCSTDRLGKSFVLDGVTYTCSGPMPYRWRAE